MNPEAAKLAEAGGWPENVPCVFCSKPITPGVAFDWYDFAGREGPGCVPGCEAWKAFCERKRTGVRKAT